MITAIIIQARMNSTRLPGKVLKEVLGKPLLAYQLERLDRVKAVDKIIVATTVNDEDQLIVDCCDRLNIPVFRGSEDDVLERYYGAAVAYGVDNIVRVTADCPIIDHRVIDKVVAFFLKNKSEYHYVSNALNETYPRGLDTEVFSFDVLCEAYKEASAKPDREHVTSFIYRQPERYRLGNISYHENLSCHRWTVDTPDDFELLRRIIEMLYPQNKDFSLEDVLLLLAKNPNWLTINRHVRQKQYGE